MLVGSAELFARAHKPGERRSPYLFDWAVASVSPGEHTPPGWGRWLLVRRQILTLTRSAYVMIDSLGGVGAVLSNSRPESLSRLYQDLRLELRYEPREHAVVVTASPRVVN